MVSTIVPSRYRRARRGLLGAVLAMTLGGAAVSTAAAAPPPKAPAITWSPTSVNLTIPRGGSVITTAAFTASRKQANVSVTAVGPVAALLNLSPVSDETVTAGTSVSVTIDNVIPPNAALGTYS